jgi:hypothetical protein
MMEVDPFDMWYAKQLTVDGGLGSSYKPDLWDLFTITHDQNSSDTVQEKESAIEDVERWLDAQKSSNLPGIDIL